MDAKNHGLEQEEGGVRFHHHFLYTTVLLFAARHQFFFNEGACLGLLEPLLKSQIIHLIRVFAGFKIDDFEAAGLSKGAHI